MMINTRTLAKTVKLPACVIALVFAMPAVLSAQNFESRLVRGTDVPVCDAYVAARNRVRETVVSACEIGRPLEGNGITRPAYPMKYLNLTWVSGSDSANAEMSEGAIQRNLKFFESQIKPFAIRNDARLARYYTYQYSEEFGWRSEDAEWKGTKEQKRIASLSLDSRIENSLVVHTLPIAYIDIDNDGIPDPVFFFLREPASWKPRSLGVPLGAPIILTSDLNGIDTPRTLSILRRPIPYDATSTWREVPRMRRKMAAGDFLSDSEYGFFRYESRNYFDVDFRQDGLDATPPIENDFNISRVYLSEHGETHAICEIECVRSETKTTTSNH